MFPWVKPFEKEFKVTAHSNNTFLIIEGKTPYKQSLNNNRFMVSVPINMQNYPFSHYIYYTDVAFLVTQWIKVQDSLEMIFNLLCGTSNKSLEVLSYVRSKRISAWEFALYLEHAHKIILINRVSANGVDNSRVTGALINRLMSHYTVKLLMVGTRKLPVINSVTVFPNEYGQCIHPSGVNLNRPNNTYYEIWYQMNNQFVVGKSRNFNINDFSVLK